MIGSTSIAEKNTMKTALEEMAASRASSLIIHAIITHGKEAASNGTITFDEGNRVAFCDVYHFSTT